MLSRKGQVFTPDFVASITLFSIFLIMFGVIWNSSVQAFLSEPNSADIQNEYAFDLLKTSGEPDGWTSNNVVVPGLYSDGRFSAEKFLEFYDIDVQGQRRLLRVQDFYMEFEYLNGSTVNRSGQELKAFSGPDLASEGSFPDNSSVYVREEIGVLEENGKRVKFKFYSWEN